MIKIKRLLRLFAFICLLLLAIFGIGLVGGVPLPTTFKREDSPLADTELVEDENEEDIKEWDGIKG